MPRHHTIDGIDVRFSEAEERARDLEEAAAKEAHQLSLDTDEARAKAVASLKSKLSRIGLSAAEIDALL